LFASSGNWLAETATYEGRVYGRIRASVRLPIKVNLEHAFAPLKGIRISAPITNPVQFGSASMV